MEKFFSTFQVAKMCHVSPGSVIRWIHEGKVPAAVTAGGHHRIAGADVATLLQSLGMPMPSVLEENPGVSQTNGKTKILIVDDERGMRQLIRSILEQNFDHLHIEEADEGFLAGWQTHRLHPDLVIVDLVLPGAFNGFSLCQLIRSFPELKHTRILAITGMNASDAETKLLKFGADDFLPKPFDPDDLKDRVLHQLQVLQGARLHVKSK